VRRRRIKALIGNDKNAMNGRWRRRGGRRSRGTGEYEPKRRGT
jgi:hypothetical protein